MIIRDEVFDMKAIGQGNPREGEPERGICMTPSPDLSNTIMIKIGGSCLANGRAIKTVVEKIARVNQRGIAPIVVVSALKGMTDSLLEVATNSHPDKDPRAIDRILSEGERLSAKILRSALESNGLLARVIDLVHPEFPIVTDDNHGNASIIIDESKKRIRSVILPMIRKGTIPIIPGFVGKTLVGEITTMGRGSSDTTAILIGQTLGAREIILLKDVPGILSGDAKIVDSPIKLSRITIEESLNLGIRGGKVLCPDSLMFKPKAIKVRIVNFDNGNLLEGGTEIMGELEDRMKVEIDSEMKTAVTIIGNKMSDTPGLLAKFSKALSNEGINIFSVSASQFSICFYVNMKQQVTALRVLHEIVLKTEDLTAVTSMPTISLITIAGKDFAIRTGVLGKIGTALARERINIIDISTSVCEADILVDCKDAKRTKEVLEGLF